MRVIQTYFVNQLIKGFVVFSSTSGYSVRWEEKLSKTLNSYTLLEMSSSKGKQNIYNTIREVMYV